VFKCNAASTLKEEFRLRAWLRSELYPLGSYNHREPCANTPLAGPTQHGIGRRGTALCTGCHARLWRLPALEKGHLPQASTTSREADTPKHTAC